MKNSLKLLIVLLLSGIAIHATSQTIKERIDEASVVHVYFNTYPIWHDPGTGQLNTGTTCTKFEERTPMPDSFIQSSKKVIEMLNAAFNTSVFVEGDSANYEADQSIKFLITTTGKYTVRNTAMAGQEQKLKNFLVLETYMTVMAPVKEKLKSVGYAAVAGAVSESKETKECDKFAYFVENFPAEPLLEPYTTSLDKGVSVFVEKEMKKYDKAMKKKAKKAKK